MLKKSQLKLQFMKKKRLLLLNQLMIERSNMYQLTISKFMYVCYLDRKKSENSIFYFSQKRSLRISEVVDELELSGKRKKIQVILRIHHQQFLALPGDNFIH